MSNAKTITVTDAAKQVNLSEQEFRELLRDYYKTADSVKRISIKNFESIVEKLAEPLTDWMNLDGCDYEGIEPVPGLFQSYPLTCDVLNYQVCELPIQTEQTETLPMTNQQPEPMNDNNLEQVESQRQQDIEDALKSTFEQGVELGQLIEESYWIGAAMGRVKSRSSERVRRLQETVLNPGFTKTSSANVLQSYLETSGFFGMLPPSPEPPKRLTD